MAMECWNDRDLFVNRFAVRHHSWCLVQGFIVRLFSIFVLSVTTKRWVSTIQNTSNVTSSPLKGSLV